MRSPFPDRALPRDDVLFRAQAGGAADLQLSPVDPSFLVADLPLYLGRAAPSSLHGAARLGADAGHGLFGRAVDAELGWHDQRADDAERRVGRSEEHTSELQSLMRISYAVF